MVEQQILAHGYDIEVPFMWQWCLLWFSAPTKIERKYPQGRKDEKEDGRNNRTMPFVLPSNTASIGPREIALWPQGRDLRFEVDDGEYKIWKRD